MKAGIYSIFLGADELNTQQRILVQYGIDGAPPQTTLSTGTIGNEEILFAKGVGTIAYYIQNRFFLNRGTQTGTTPIMRNGILKFLKIPNKRDIFDLTIDVEETYKARRAKVSTEDILLEIGSLAKSRIQLPFKYGKIATRLVLVDEAPGQEFDEELPNTQLEQDRSGLVSIRLMEMLSN